MTYPLMELEGTWEEIAARAPDFVGHRLRVTVLSQEDNSTPAVKPIEEIIEELAAQVPPEIWEELPSDLSSNLDHYLYGTPKRP